MDEKKVELILLFVVVGVLIAEFGWAGYIYYSPQISCTIMVKDVKHTGDFWIVTPQFGFKKIFREYDIGAEIDFKIGMKYEVTYIPPIKSMRMRRVIISLREIS